MTTTTETWTCPACGAVPETPEDPFCQACGLDLQDPERARSQLEDERTRWARWAREERISESTRDRQIARIDRALQDLP